MLSNEKGTEGDERVEEESESGMLRVFVRGDRMGRGGGWSSLRRTAITTNTGRFKERVRGRKERDGTVVK